MGIIALNLIIILIVLTYELTGIQSLLIKILSNQEKALSLCFTPTSGSIINANVSPAKSVDNHNIIGFIK